MQTVNEISNSDGKAVILFPLTTIILITAVKDLFEDWKRHKSDNKENSKKTLKLIGSLTEIKNKIKNERI